MRSSRAVRLWCIPLLLLLLLAWSGVASSNERAVTIGEVSSGVTRSDVDIPSLLRSALVEELLGLDLPPAKKHGPMVLSVSLVRMDTAADGASASTSCVVSATLRAKRGGTVFAVLEGHARAEDQPSKVGALEQSTMRAALRGAVGRIPEALR
jgi:hypothetical protein